MRHIKLSLVVPFYNEEETIRGTVRILTSYLNKHYRDQYELIFVNDGSTDRSVAILRDQIRKRPKARLISYFPNRGRGYAISRGFRQARGLLVGYIDSDLEIHQRYIQECAKKIDKFDIAVVSKRLPDSRVQTTLLRRLASTVFNQCVKIILGSTVSDHQGGLKIFKSQVIKATLPKVRSEGWLFDTEMLYFAQQAGYKIAEVPIKVKYGFGRIRGSMVLDFFKAIVVVSRLRLTTVVLLL